VQYSCRESCPLGGKRESPDQEWLDRCTCPGSRRVRDLRQNVGQESEARKARNAEVLRDVKVGQMRSAGEIQQKISAAYRRHIYEPPSDFSRWSRFMAAATARRGARTVRLVGEAVSGLRAARRWTPEPADQDVPVPDRRPGYAREKAREDSGLKRLSLAAAGYGAVALAATTGAYFTGGIARIVLAIIAAFFGASAAWVTLVSIGIDTFVHVIRTMERRRERWSLRLLDLRL
jgi:hypothetical protein